MMLSEWLALNNVSQEDFGSRVGCTQGRISQICRNGTESLLMALKINKETGGAVSIEELVWMPWDATEDAV